MKRNADTFVSALLRSRIFFGILILITIASVFRLTNEIARRSKIQSELSALRRQTLELQREHESLSVLIDYLKTDAYVEQAARKKLNLADPDEKLVIVSETDDVVERTIKPGSADPATLWWEYFFEAENK